MPVTLAAAGRNFPHCETSQECGNCLTKPSANVQSITAHVKNALRYEEASLQKENSPKRCFTAGKSGLLKVPVYSNSEMLSFVMKDGLAKALMMPLI